MAVDFILLFALLAATILFIYGLFLLVFRRGRRRKGAWIIAGSLAATLVTGGIIADHQVKREGWESFSEMSAAEDAGIADPAVWATTQAVEEGRRLAEQARLQAEVRQKAEQDAAAAAEAVAEAERVAVEQAAEEQRLAQAKADEDAKEKRYGFHCLSPWNGSHRELVRAVKDRLNDPDSFEHDETRTWPVRDDGRNQVLMTYRARNGFNALTLGKAVATFDNESCDMTIETLD